MPIKPFVITIQGKDDSKPAFDSAISNEKRLADETRAAANVAKSEAADKKRAYEQASAAAKTASGDGKAAAQAVAAAAKEEANAARDAAKGLEENARAAEKISAEKARAVTTALKEQESAAKAAARANQENVSQLRAVSGRFQQTGQSTPGAGLLSIRASGGVGAMRDDWRQVAKSTRDAGDGGPMGVAGLNASADAAARLQSQLGGVRTAGIGMTVVGAVALRNAGNIAKISLEAQNARQDLEALLNQQKRGGDTEKVEGVVADISVKAHLADPDELRRGVTQLVSDEVKTSDISALTEAIVRNAQTLQKKGQSANIEEISKSFSVAYAQGNLGRLQRQNINFTEEEKSAVKAAYAISKLAGQTELMKVITAATARDTNELGASLTGQARAAADAQRELHEFSVNTGAGVVDVQTSFHGIGAEILNVANRAPALEEIGGGLYYIAGSALATAGPMIALGAQTLQLVNGFRAFQLARAAAAAADDAASASIGANTAVTTTAGGAALSSSLEFDALTAAETEAGIAADAEAISITAAGAASAAAGAEATLASVAFSGLGMLAGGLGAIIGAAAGAGIFYLAQLTGEIDKQKGFLDSLSDGWAAFKDQFSGGGSAESQANQRDLDKGLGDIKAKNAAAVLHGTKTQEQADKDGLADEIKLRDSYAREADRQGDSKMMVEQQQAEARLKQQQKGAALPIAAPPIAPSAPSASAPASPDDSSAAPDGTATSGDSNESGIRAQEDAIDNESDKTKKKEMHEQLRHMREAAQDSKRQTAATEKLAKSAKREADKAEKVADEDDLLLSKKRNDIDSANKIDDLESQLEAAKESQNESEIGRLTYEIALAKAEKTYQDAMAAASQEKAGKHRDALKQAAQMQYDADQSRAMTAGHKAEASAEKSGNSKTPKLGASQIAALFSASGAGSRSILDGAFSALDPSGTAGAGHRFDGMAPMVDFDAMTPRYTQGVPDVGRFERDKGRGGSNRATSRETGRKQIQKANGEYVTKLEIEVTTPYNDPFGGWDGD